jgi:hypothetical protein
MFHEASLNRSLTVRSVAIHLLMFVALFVSAVPSYAATAPFVTAGAEPFDRSAWEGAVTAPITTDTFSNDIANADFITFDSGVTSEGFDPQGSPVNNLVDSTLGTSGRYSTILRTATATDNGYLSITWTFPSPVTAFGADFFSIGGSRQVSVLGDFGMGDESFDLRQLFINDGGLDQGFFGIVASSPFTSITLAAVSPTFAGNDAFTVDNLAFVPVPEPGTWALLALGLAMAGLATRKRASWLGG